MVSIVISVVSLLLSLTVAFFTLWWRGKLAMTRPVLFGFLYEGEQPKVFFRAMLYATGKRGHVIEALYLKVRRGGEAQTFDFWMYGETKDLKIGSGLRAGEDGVSFNHHFLPPKGDASFHFLPGKYTISIYARAVNRKKPLLLSSVTLRLSESHAHAVREKTHWAVFTQEPESQAYRCEIAEGREPAPPVVFPLPLLHLLGDVRHGKH